MATSHFDGSGPRGVRLPADADAHEAAVIVAAIRRHLAEEEAEAADEPLRIDRWRLTARLESVTHRRVEVPPSIPDDPWIAAGRLPR